MVQYFNFLHRVLVLRGFLLPGLFFFFFLVFTIAWLFFFYGDTIYVPKKLTLSKYTIQWFLKLCNHHQSNSITCLSAPRETLYSVTVQDSLEEEGF